MCCSKILRIARGFQPMTSADMQALRERCKFFASDGRYELFKVTKKYDGSVGRQQHHFPFVGRVASIKVRLGALVDHCDGLLRSVVFCLLTS